MKILIVDDHALFRDGMSHILQDLTDEVEVLQCGNVDETLELLSDETGVDLVLIDICMPGKNGLDALEIFAKDHPTLPIVVLSASNNQQEMRKAIQLGAMGFIRKDATSSVMLNALRLIMDGEVYIPSSMLQQQPTQTTLTPRQIEVLALMDQGLANKLIADQLNISEPTVKMHITAIFRELNVTNRTQAVLKAREIQLL